METLVAVYMSDRLYLRNEPQVQVLGREVIVMTF